MSLSTSRICTPGMERAEPLIKSLPAGAKAMTGLCKRSFMREAKIPITP